MRLFGAPSTVVEPDPWTLPQWQSLQEVSGTIFDIQRFSVNDGPGIRTIVFMKLCGMRCAWCSNPESQQARPDLMFTPARCLNCDRCERACPEHAIVRTADGIRIDRTRCTRCGECVAVCPSGALRQAGQTVNAAEVLREVERDLPFYKHSGGGMTLSGGEPLAQPEFALALLRLARAHDLHTAVETCGWTSRQMIQRVLSETDLILFDLKHPDPTAHARATGKPNTRILENAIAASRLGVPMIVRTPVIPGFNDDPRDLVRLGQFARRLGVREMHLLPYHRYAVPKYAALDREYPLPQTAALSAAELEPLRRTLEQIGLEIRIGG